MFYDQEQIDPVFIGDKTCGDCGETKPRAEFNRDAKAADGLRSYCRACQKKRSAATMQRYREANAGRDPFDGSLKYCCRCKTDLPRSRAYWATAPSRKDGLDGRCLLCQAVKTSDLVDRVDHLWRKESYTKRTKQRGDWIDHGKAEWLDLLIAQKCRCALTGRKLTKDNVSIDHVLQLQHGGDHSLTNLRLVTLQANQARKSISDAELFSLCRDYIKVQADPSALWEPELVADVDGIVKKVKELHRVQIKHARRSLRNGKTSRVDRLGQIGEPLTDHQWGAMVIRQRGYCAYTHRPLTPANVSIDHALALDAGGLNTASNLVLVTHEVNDLKHAMHVEELFLFCIDVCRTLRRQYR